MTESYLIWTSFITWPLPYSKSWNHCNVRRNHNKNLLFIVHFVAMCVSVSVYVVGNLLETMLKICIWNRLVWSIVFHAQHHLIWWWWLMHNVLTRTCVYSLTTSQLCEILMRIQKPHWATFLSLYFSFSFFLVLFLIHVWLLVFWYGCWKVSIWCGPIQWW